MPHAFNANPDHPADAYLARLHADLGGQIPANKAEAKRLADDMRHVDAVLKMFDPDYNVRAISARRAGHRESLVQPGHNNFGPPWTCSGPPLSP
jgi:hypothetical protein